MSYITHIVTIFTIYFILAASLDLVVGHTGLVSLAHSGFWGLGAYTSALLSLHLGLPFVGCLVLSMILPSILSLFVSLPSARLHGDFFAIATFGLQMILFSIFNNMTYVTGGALGLANIPLPKILGFTVAGEGQFLLLATLVAILAMAVLYAFARPPFGRVLHSIREDEVLARSLGKNVMIFKIIVCAVSAAMAGAAGCLYASYITYIDPTSFTISESILVLSMVIIGGAGRFWGSLGGAALLTICPEVLRLLGLQSAQIANARQLLYGLILLLVLIVRPQGLVGEYDLRKR